VEGREGELPRKIEEKDRRRNSDCGQAASLIFSSSSGMRKNIQIDKNQEEE